MRSIGKNGKRYRKLDSIGRYPKMGSSTASAETGLIGEKTIAVLAKLKMILANIDARAEFQWTGRFAEIPAAPMSSLFWVPEAMALPFQRLQMIWLHNGSLVKPIHCKISLPFEVRKM